MPRLHQVELSRRCEEAIRGRDQERWPKSETQAPSGGRGIPGRAEAGRASPRRKAPLCEAAEPRGLAGAGPRGEDENRELLAEGHLRGPLRAGGTTLPGIHLQARRQTSTRHHVAIIRADRGRGDRNQFHLLRCGCSEEPLASSGHARRRGLQGRREDFDAKAEGNAGRRQEGRGRQGQLHPGPNVGRHQAQQV